MSCHWQSVTDPAAALPGELSRCILVAGGRFRVGAGWCGVLFHARERCGDFGRFLRGDSDTRLQQDPVTSPMPAPGGLRFRSIGAARSGLVGANPGRCPASARLPRSRVSRRRPRGRFTTIGSRAELEIPAGIWGGRVGETRVFPARGNGPRVQARAGVGRPSRLESECSLGGNGVRAKPFHWNAPFRFFFGSGVRPWDDCRTARAALERCARDNQGQDDAGRASSDELSDFFCCPAGYIFYYVLGCLISLVGTPAPPPEWHAGIGLRQRASRAPPYKPARRDSNRRPLAASPQGSSGW